MRLRSREKFIPGGFQFRIPQIPRWQPQQWSSLQSMAEQVLAVRQANPALTAQHGWSLDLNQILNELDSFNANICAAMGWTQYIVGAEGSPSPKLQAPTAADLSRLSAAGAKAKLIFAGVKTLNDWLDSGEPSVPQAQSEARAQTCVACPLNGPGDFTQWFVKPAAAAIKGQIERLEERKLSTSVDDKLGVCSACLCPNRLSVWTPIKFIKSHLKDEVIDKLRQGNSCWKIAELAAG